MVILTHGSDLALAPTLTPIARAAGGSTKVALTRIAEAGFGCVQLDATLSGLRPRELDASARRDLQATARRAGLAITGIDLFIPGSHYLEPQHVDRAMQATLDAITFAGELDRIPLSIQLPVDQLDDEQREVLLAAADGHGVALVVHAEEQIAKLTAWLGDADPQVAGLGIDPAAMLGGRGDPVAVLQQHAKQLNGARLSDNRRGVADGSRRALGQGDLDVMSYRISADLAPNRRGPIVLDLRGLTDPLNAAILGKQAWEDAGQTL